MRRILIGWGLSLLATGCSVPGTSPSLPAPGTLEARVELGGYQTQSMASEVSIIKCKVEQGSQTFRQELPAASLASQAFLFKLSEGTASVATDAYDAQGTFLGGSYAVVGIRSAQVTMLRTTILLDNSLNSSFHPLLPLPIQGATVSAGGS